MSGRITAVIIIIVIINNTRSSGLALKGAAAPSGGLPTQRLCCLSSSSCRVFLAASFSDFHNIYMSATLRLSRAAVLHTEAELEEELLEEKHLWWEAPEVQHVGAQRPVETGRSSYIVFQSKGRILVTLKYWQTTSLIFYSTAINQWDLFHIDLLKFF